MICLPLSTGNYSYFYRLCTIKFFIYQASSPAINFEGVSFVDTILECCAGIDVHRDILQVCILKGTSDTPTAIRGEFKAMQDDLQNMVSWFIKNECYHIAMESAGVYWKPVYEAIERYHVYCQTLMVVNAYHMRNVPGRKSDVKDAEWIPFLLRCGLLRPSFVPDKTTRTLREYSRLYKSFTWEKARYMNRIEKFLQIHGFKLSSVLSSIFTQSGRALLTKLIEKGYLQLPDVQDSLNKGVKKSSEEIHLAIKGELNLYERKLLKTLLGKVEQIEEEIKNILALMQEVACIYSSEIEQLDSIPGIDVLAATTIIAEISAQPKKHFDSSEKLC